MAEFNQLLCNERHIDTDRRLTVVETSIKENLVRIYDKLDSMGKRPTWAVAVIITLLMTACGSMAVFLLTRGGH